MKVTKTIYTETAHRLQHHPGLCQNLHGHSYKWEVTVSGTSIDPTTGMLIDFSDLKNLLVRRIEEPFDHATALDPADPLFAILEPTGLKLLKMKTGEAPTAETFAMITSRAISAVLGEPFLVEVKCWETTTSYATSTACNGVTIVNGGY